MMFPSGYLKTVYGLIEPEADYNLLSEDQKEGLGQAIEQALNEKEKCCVAMLSENISPKLIAEEIGVSGPRYYAIKKNIKKKLGQYEYRKTYEYGAEGWLVERNRCREAIKEAVRTGDTRDAFLLRADWVFDIDFNTMKHIYTSVCQYRDDGRDYMKYVTDPAVTVDDLVFLLQEPMGLERVHNVGADKTSDIIDQMLEIGVVDENTPAIADRIRRFERRQRIKTKTYACRVCGKEYLGYKGSYKKTCSDECEKAWRKIYYAEYKKRKKEGLV